MNNENLMTVGVLASKMNVTVRTLQYYDKQGLLKPSSQSEGGRRLYTDKDMIKLNQILSLKFLGFSLEDIKIRLIPIDTPKEVDKALKNQASIIKDKISYLQEALTAIESLREEIHQMNSIDWKKYSDIISLLKSKNENYWVVKYFDTDSFHKIKTSFTHEDSEKIISTWHELCDHIIQLKSQNELPTGSKAQLVAKDWWDMVNRFTGGDITMLKDLVNFNKDKENWNTDWKEKQTLIDDFLEQALFKYFKDNNIEVPKI